MADKVIDNGWDSETASWLDFTSEREYDRYVVAATAEDSTPWGFSDRKAAVNLVVFVDEETGLITNSPRKFEKWLKANRLG